MNKIISDIKKEMEKRRLSESALANMVGTNQPKVHRVLAGKSKFVDMEAVNKIADALGIVMEDDTHYGTPCQGGAVSSEEAALLDMVRGDKELLRDVIKYTEEKKLLKDLLREKQDKKAG